MQVLRYREVAERVHYTPVHIRRLIKSGDFPKPIKLGGRRVVFDSAEIDEWLQAKADDRAVSN